MIPKSKKFDFITIFIFLFMVYALTAPHTVTLEDSGELIMTSHYWGVAHPPGYPLYTFLGKLFSLLPISTVAYRLHLLSAIFGALGCAMLYLCSMKFLNERFVALGLAVAYGLSLTFWSQAIVAEVYSLNAFLFLLLLYLALELSEGVSRRLVNVFSLCFGLSLANHWPLILLNLPILLVLLWPMRNLILRFWRSAMAFLVVGLLPYAVMIWRSAQSGEMVFSGPIASLAELLNFVLRKEYMALEASPTATLWDSMLFFTKFLVQALKEFSYAGGALIFLGIFATVRSFPRKRQFIFAWGALSSSFFLKLAEINDFEPLNLEAYLVYHLIPYAFLALLMGAGLVFLQQRFPRVPAYVTPLLVITIVLGLHWPLNNRRTDDFAYRYATTVLQQLPESAKLFVSAETDAGPIGYAHYVGGVRPDVGVYSQFGLLFKNRIFDPAHDSVETKIAKSRGFFRANAPIYFSTPLFFIDANSVAGLTASKRGLYTVLAPSAAPANGEELIRAAKEFLDAQLTEPYLGPWQYHAGSIFTYFCSALAQAKIEHEFAARNPFCLTQYAAEKFASQDFEGADRLFQGLVQREPFLNKPEHSQLVNLFAQNRINFINSKNPSSDRRKEEYLQVTRILRQALDRFPSCENAVLKTLAAIDKQAGISAEDIFMQKRFADCQP